MNIELIVVSASSLLWAVFALTNLYWKPGWALNMPTNRMLTALGIISFVFQVIYGVSDIFLGIAVEQFGSQWAATGRAVIANPFPSSLAFCTDIIASAIAYAYFFDIATSLHAMRTEKTDDLAVNAELKNIAFNLALMATTLSVLIKFVNIYIWNTGNTLMYLGLGYCVIAAAVAYKTLDLGKFKFSHSKDVQALLTLGLVYPLLEPLLGNAFQFFGFFIIIASIMRRRKISPPELAEQMQQSVPLHQKIAIFSLISLSLSCLASLTFHMTAFPPIENMFATPVTAAGIYQLATCLLLLGLFLRGFTGKLASMLGVFNVLAIFLVLMPFTSLFAPKPDSPLMSVVGHWPSSALNGSLLLLMLGLLAPLALYAYVEEDDFGSLTPINLRKVLKRNFMGNLTIDIFASVLIMLCVLPLFHSVFDSTVDKSTYGMNGLVQSFNEFKASGVEPVKMAEYCRAMIETADRVVQDIRLGFLRICGVALIAISVCLYYLTRIRQYATPHAFLKMLRGKYPSEIRLQAVRAMNEDRSVLAYFTAFSLTPIVFVSLFAVTFSIICWTDGNAALAPFFGYRDILAQELARISTP